MNAKRLEILYADPKSLKPNPWNTNIVSPENEQKLSTSMDELDMFKPILVRTLPDGSLEILGGEHRSELAAKKGVSSVPIINLGVMDDIRAKKISLVDNGRYGADDTLALAELFSSIGSPEDISALLPFTDVELNSIFSSAEIDLSELDLGDADEPPNQNPSPPPVQTHQIMRFKVPIEDAHKITDRIEAIIKEQNFCDHDSLTNAGDALVHLIVTKE